jgi:UDP-N-acetylmuramate dehydrogenase
MDDKLDLLKAELGEVRVKSDELIKYHTYSKLGGPAQWFYIATSQKELLLVLNTCYELKVPYFLIGSGTKVMISDKGLRGLVIKNRSVIIKLGAIKGKVGKDGLGIEEAQIESDSGVLLGRLNEYLRGQKLQEINGISSVHSTVGGALFLDPALLELTEIIKVWQDGDVFEIKPFELQRNKHIIISAIFRVKAA